MHTYIHTYIHTNIRTSTYIPAVLYEVSARPAYSTQSPSTNSSLPGYQAFESSDWKWAHENLKQNIVTQWHITPRCYGTFLFEFWQELVQHAHLPTVVHQMCISGIGWTYIMWHHMMLYDVMWCHIWTEAYNTFKVSHTQIQIRNHSNETSASTQFLTCLEAM